MPADVETMFYAGQVPWHGIGTAIPHDVNAEQAIKLAQLDWDVETAPIVTNDQKKTAVDDYRVTRRIQDNAILGVVPKRFKPIQNRDAFGLFDSVVGEGKAVYHTAGSLQGGSKVWILSKLPQVLEVGKGIGHVDEVERYLLLSNAHDGTRPLQMLFTPVRVVCSNTLGMALEIKGNTDKVTRIAPRVTIPHNINAKAKMKQAGRLMKAALNYYEKFGDFAKS
jgi:phage/plasmid-like protein (TIGR03299 family)